MADVLGGGQTVHGRSHEKAQGLGLTLACKKVLNDLDHGVMNVTVRRDQEVSITTGVSLTKDETSEIAAAFPPAIKV